MSDPLGDRVEKALSAIGVTDERVSQWLGRPCGCKRRKQKLNQLDAWARRVLAGQTENAIGYLGRIIGDVKKRKNKQRRRRHR